MTPEQSIAEIRTALVGIDGKNGLRGELRTLTARVDKMAEELSTFKHDIEHVWQEYLLQRREDTCYGKAELQKYIEEQDRIQKKRTEEHRESDKTMITLETARLDYEKTIKAERMRSFVSIIVAIIAMVAAIVK